MSGDNLQDWVGRTQREADRIGPTPVRALAATLDRSDEIATDPGAELPGIWSWLFFLPIVPMAQVGPDGHPRRGGFLPPVALPRRMWAGSRMSFHAPLRIGDAAERTSSILKVSEKTGKAGPMVFVTVKHVVHAEDRLVLEEEQDIVYVAMPERFVPPEPQPVPALDFEEPLPSDAVFLFRFSALTFNGHRIHYDRRYASEVEKYPGLVVHGPLQALLLHEAARRHAPGRTPARFEFRGVRPLFDFERLRLGGRGRPDGAMDLYTANADGAIGMQATMHWSGS